MNKKDLIEMFADFLCFKSGKLGTFEIHAFGDTKDDGEYIVRDLKEIVHNFILDSNKFGFVYEIKIEDEFETIYNSKGYILHATVVISNCKDIKNFWRIIRNSTIKKYRKTSNLFVFHINWR